VLAAGGFALAGMMTVWVPAAQAQAVVFAGTDTVELELPAGALVEPYANAGYELAVDRGRATVSVQLTPLRSRQPFSRPPIGPPRDPLAQLARAITAGASTRYEAVTEVLQWVGRNVEYSLDRGAPQDAAAVLARRSGYCTGIARLSVALLRALDIPARDVPGFVVAAPAAGVPAGFHRWVEVRYDDVGWVFSVPLVSLHYVPATYVRLASEGLLPEAELQPGKLLAHTDGRVAVDIFSEASPRLTVRRNDVVRRAAALRVTVDGAMGGRAVLEGRGTRRIRSLRAGESTFVGLEPGSYLLRVEVPGASPSLKRVILRDRVWGAVHVVATPATPRPDATHGLEATHDPEPVPPIATEEEST
jgi:hypothetical protein